MHGTRQRLAMTAKLGLAVAAIACAVPAVAHAYHNGNVFADPPGAGGGGDIFYTGSVREKKWDCTFCHIDPPKRLALNVTSNPPDLITQLRYTPGTTYAITVAFANPTAQLGLTATRSNFNSMVITTEDSMGVGAGTFSGFDSGKFFARGSSILASDSPTVNETSWTFNWVAPPTSAGPITLNLAVVDGNGANSDTTRTLTDLLGDDVALVAYTVTDTMALRAIQWAAQLFSAATTFSTALLASPNSIFVTGL